MGIDGGNLQVIHTCRRDTGKKMSNNYCYTLGWKKIVQQGGANPAVNTPRPSRGTRIESCDFIVLIGDP